MPKETYETLWPGWDTVGVIGRGSFGAVYKIERDVMGHKEQAALKHISIPKSESDINDLIADGYDEDSITLRFREYLKDIIQEYSTMSEIKGCANIVYAEDVRYVQHDDGIGWDIYIRMELLTPLNKALTGTVDERQVLRVGKALCNALSFCEQKNILHRDIKPQNIFVGPDGTYKLGDFGIAKVSDRTTSGTTAGTFSYMSPEVFNHQPYGPKADLYSLGLVLYWLLNERRTPYLPLPPQVPTATNEERARERRFQGDVLPLPAHGSPALQAVVLKACAFRPEDRYRNAAEMLEDLRRVEQPGMTDSTEVLIRTEKVGADDETVGLFSRNHRPTHETTSEEVRKQNNNEFVPGTVKKKNKKPLVLAAVVIGCAAVVGLGLFAGLSRSGGKESSESTGSTSQIATTMPLDTEDVSPEFTLEPTSAPKSSEDEGLYIVRQHSENDSWSYDFITDTCSWSKAFQNALDAGGHLACFETEEELEYAISELNRLSLYNVEFLIGAHRNGEEYSYFWVDTSGNNYGEVLNNPGSWIANYWLEGEPSFNWDGTFEEVVEIYFAPGYEAWLLNDIWEDVTEPNVGQYYGYIIEYD